MMNPNRQTPARNAKSTPMPIKLAGLFALSFALFFILFLGYDLLSGFAEKRAAAASTNDEARPIVIDPKIADDLAKVLAADSNPQPDAVKDPFNDRGGLSRSASGTAIGSSAVASTTGPMTAPGIASAPRVSTPKGSTGNTAPGPPTVTVATNGTKERYDNWLKATGYSGEAPVDPRVFAIADLLPVGIVDGGTGAQEVMFFSEAAGKTMSFPVGTIFFDGWLTELRPEGVVFSSFDDPRVVRMRSWARSVKNAG